MILKSSFLMKTQTFTHFVCFIWIARIILLRLNAVHFLEIFLRQQSFSVGCFHSFNIIVVVAFGGPSTFC